MNSASDSLKAFLDKLDSLLAGNPARMIGYGAAAVVVAVVAISNALGYTRFGDNIDMGAALIVTTGLIGSLTLIVESIRRFVFSPETYVAHVEAAVEAGHAQAHMEEDLQAFIEARQATASPQGAVFIPNNDLKN